MGARPPVLLSRHAHVQGRFLNAVRPRERVQSNNLSATRLDSVIAFAQFCPLNAQSPSLPPPTYAGAPVIYGPVGTLYWLTDRKHCVRGVHNKWHPQVAPAQCRAPSCQSRWCPPSSLSAMAYCHSCSAWQHESCLGPETSGPLGPHEGVAVFQGRGKPLYLTLPPTRRIPRASVQPLWLPVSRSLDIDVSLPIETWERVVDAYLRTARELHNTERAMEWAPFSQRWKDNLSAPTTPEGVVMSGEACEKAVQLFVARWSMYDKDGAAIASGSCRRACALCGNAI